MKGKVLPQNFYVQDTEKVAKQLLGNFLIKKIGNKEVIAKIVETEAYYGLKDPASRAFTTPKMAQQMWSEGGETFVYMVHNNYLLNIVTEKKGIPAAVLIRALEPLTEHDILKTNRKKDGFDLTNGPGKLTQALSIKKLHNNIKVFDKHSEITIAEPLIKQDFLISSTHRIGVKQDLKRKLRFFIQGNRWVSKGKIISKFSD